MQFTLLQQRFSWSLGIGLQASHLHHSGELLLPGLGGGGGGAFVSSRNFFAKSSSHCQYIPEEVLYQSCLVSADRNS